MFTGIVTDIGEVLAIEERAEGLRRLTIACAYDRPRSRSAHRSACAGVCMTAVATGRRQARHFSVDAAAETLRLTTVGRWQNGTRVNLERSLKIGDELGGHLVSGHVDGLAELVDARGPDRHGALDAARAEAARALHRAEGLGRARRRVADGERG